MQDQHKDLRDFMSLGEHARRLDRSLFTVRNRTAAGKWPVPTVKMGGRRMVPVAAHEAYVRSLLEQTQQQPLPEAPSPAPAQPQQPAKRKPGRPRTRVVASARGHGERGERGERG